MKLYIIAYVILINILGILSMWIDKRKSIKHKWRISEKTLLYIALLGGSIGSLCGMYLFRHKTQKMRFAVGIPAILIFQILAIIFIVTQYVI